MPQQATTQMKNIRKCVKQWPLSKLNYHQGGYISMVARFPWWICFLSTRENVFAIFSPLFYILCAADSPVIA